MCRGSAHMMEWLFYSDLLDLAGQSIATELSEKRNYFADNNDVGHMSRYM